MPTHVITTLTSLVTLRALLPEWIRLFYTSGTTNPFSHPLWVLAWAQHFLAPHELHAVILRTPGGALVGVAPFYKRQQRVAPGVTLRRLQLLGAGQHVQLTELPQPLFAPGHARTGLRDLMHYVSADDDAWDWAELTLAPDQGWFEPEWVPQAGPGAGSALFHRATRVCVVLPLPTTVEEWHAGLKRNVKESMRSGVNRLARTGHRWTLVTPGDAATLGPAIDDLVALHRARATMQGTVQHPDYLQDPTDRAFLHTVASDLFHAGHLSICFLEVGGSRVAGRLLLHANGATFFSVSGVDPAWRAYSVGTILQAECLRQAIARGDLLANLSIGPDVAKLRWSEHLHFYHDVTLVRPHRRSRRLLAVLWHGRSAIRLWR
jgi:CelD/BcsL family acetyltransferase involved in cellulose biosynthesis